MINTPHWKHYWRHLSVSVESKLSVSLSFPSSSSSSSTSAAVLFNDCWTKDSDGKSVWSFAANVVLWPPFSSSMAAHSSRFWSRDKTKRYYIWFEKGEILRSFEERPNDQVVSTYVTLEKGILEESGKWNKITIDTIIFTLFEFFS